LRVLIFFLPSPNSETWTEASRVLGKQRNRDEHRGAVSRSPADHYHILTIYDKLVVHVAIFFFGWSVGCYGLLLLQYCAYAEEERGLAYKKAYSIPYLDFDTSYTFAKMLREFLLA
jgi:hypothetical protein